jgi:hypothetical protein
LAGFPRFWGLDSNFGRVVGHEVGGGGLCRAFSPLSFYWAVYLGLPAPSQRSWPRSEQPVETPHRLLCRRAAGPLGAESVEQSGWELDRSGSFDFPSLHSGSLRMTGVVVLRFNCCEPNPSRVVGASCRRPDRIGQPRYRERVAYVQNRWRGGGVAGENWEHQR